MKKIIWMLVGGFVAGVLATAFFTHPPKQSADWAAWVQAFGAISAIAGAYILGERQARAALINSLKLQRQAAADKRKAIFAICTAAHNRAKTIHAIYEGEKINRNLRYATYDESIVASIVGALSAIPVHEIGTAGAVIALLDLRDQFGFVSAAIRKYEQDFADPGVQFPTPERIFCQNVRQHLAVIFSNYDVLNVEIGTP